MEMEGKAKEKDGKRSGPGTNEGRSGTTAVERKEVERERRQHMKELCTKLVSLIPKDHCSSTVSIAECNLPLSYILHRLPFSLIKIWSRKALYRNLAKKETTLDSIRSTCFSELHA